MTDKGERGSDWWQASDGNWYPPESHPDYQPSRQDVSLPALPLPAIQPPAPVPPAPVPPGLTPPGVIRSGPQPRPVSTSGSKRWLVALVSLVVAAGVAVGFLAQQDDVSDLTGQVVFDVTEPADHDEPDTETVVDAEPVMPPSGDIGTLDNPFAFDSLAPVTFATFGDADGSVWNTRVSPVRDMTAEVAQANSFNDPPPDGVMFAGFEVEMQLVSAGKEPLSPGFNFQWELIGSSTAGVYKSATIGDLLGCGAFDDQFDTFFEVVVGGALTGTVCIPLPVEDFEAGDTRVAMSFAGDTRMVFAEGGVGVEPAATGAQSQGPANSSMLAIGVEVPVQFEVVGDADGAVWNVTVGEQRIITAEVAAANPLNDAPTDGIEFVGFDVEMTLASAGKEPLSPGFNSVWELFGGASGGVYDGTTLEGVFGCGFVDDVFGNFDEAFVGGTLKGTVCIPVPVEDVGHADTQVALNVGDERFVFTADGASPAPAHVTETDGPGGFSETNAPSEPLDVTWSTFGDADGSVWTTVISPLSDLTDQVASENPLADPVPEGIRFAGFNAELTLVEAGKEPLSVGFNFKWEILGGASRRVYTPTTLALGHECGALPDVFDMFAEVFAGGSLTGTICIPLPVADLEHPDTRIALNFQGDRVIFMPR